MVHTNILYLSMPTCNSQECYNKIDISRGILFRDDYDRRMGDHRVGYFLEEIQFIKNGG